MPRGKGAASALSEGGGRMATKGKRRPSRLDEAAAAEIFRRLAAERPDPRSELNYADPFTLLVAVVLSAQATDVSVNKATRTLFRAADTPQKMLALGEARLKDHIKTIGLFNTKARNVIALSRILVEEHGGVVPRDRAALEALPGVGRKTANVVLNVAFGVPTIAVDTHIFRVGNRTGLAPGPTPLAVEEGLERIVPPQFRLGAHHWLILHGRYVCTARKPACDRCAISDLCTFDGKTGDVGAKGPPAAARKVDAPGAATAAPRRRR
ncbi:MAG: endonuclease III [Alphaproteobacteria bacterium]|nr:endonuclease III [Alphaproteobacteria bacterium]